MKNNLMARKNINVDKANNIPIANFKQEDDGVLKLALFANSVVLDCTGQTIRLDVKRPDNKLVTIEGITIANKNEIDIKMTTNCFIASGLLECDLVLTDVAGKMTTASFFVTVGKKVTGSENVQGANVIGAIDKCVEEYETWKDAVAAGKGAFINDNGTATTTVYSSTKTQAEFNKIESSLDTKAKQDELIIERERIDNLINHGNGIDNAETLDIRIGQDGVNYSSAGTSVRTQIKNAYANITDGFNKGYKAEYSNIDFYEIGGINTSGSLITDARYIRSKGFIPSYVKDIKISDSNYMFMLIRYNTTGTFIDRLTGLANYTVFDFVNYKYKIVLYHKDNATIINLSYYNKIEILGGKLEIFNEIEEFIKPNSISYDKTDFLKPSKNLLNVIIIDNKYVSWQSGILVDNASLKATDYISILPNTRISLSNHNALAFYDVNKNFISGINGSGTSGTNYPIVDGDITGQNLHGTYTTPINSAYMRITLDKKYTNQQVEYGEESTSYEEPCFYIDNFYYPKNENMEFKNTFVKVGETCTITTKKARYVFKRVVNTSINIDAWRLYEGKLLDENGVEYTMWSNSDAEGAIQIVGEEDFVCGYHGDELFDEISIVIDGKYIDITKDYNLEFLDLTIVSTSRVFHCNTSSNAGIQCFERTKKLNFEGGKVTISNRFKCLKDLNVNRAALSLFQCYKTQNGTTVINKFTNNNDLLMFDVPGVTGSMPNASKNMTQACFYTNCGVIDFKINKGQENTQYEGYIANFGDQNRLKIYFDYIKGGSTLVKTGDILQTEFQFTII